MRFCCIIKPDAIQKVDAILRTLRDAGIRAIECRSILYTDELVHQLYDHMSEEARADISRSLAGKHGLALLVEVPTLERLLDITGRESDPECCASGSVRALYGTRTPYRVGDSPWWLNAIHRPVDAREAERDLELFFPGRY